MSLSVRGELYCLTCLWNGTSGEGCISTACRAGLLGISMSGMMCYLTSSGMT